ncbi:MAG TPA: glycosyltransferase [Candidatus Hydrogenedentes bacterium]|nr:glycosyltransferase [Candidatus Hydrogenedentota bacterium]HOS02916.1 glycosyltransferase [Candidatus Hydrogenedentota bacterium]
MKVLQILPALTAGGAEGFVTNLGVHLAALGAEVRFFLLAGVLDARGRVLLERLQNAGVEVIGAQVRRPASLGNLLRLRRLIRSWRPDIAQANLYPAEVACAVANMTGTGGTTLYVRRLANTDQCGHRSSCIVKSLDFFFRTTIACSPQVAEAYAAFMGSKQRSVVVTIPNGGLLQPSVTTEEEKRLARRAWNLPDQAFVVAHIGRMFGAGEGLRGGLRSGQKAHDVLLQAFAQAFGSDPQCRLLLVGDGPLRPEAEALAHALHIEDQTHFLGQQPEPWPTLRAADLFCFPSRYEGLPNVLPEAASCGLPVTASNIPEIRFLHPGDAWRLVPVDDVSGFAEAMRAMRANYAFHLQCARDAALRFREQFSMQACAEKYVQAYEQALGRRGSRVLR